MHSDYGESMAAIAFWFATLFTGAAIYLTLLIYIGWHKNFSIRGVGGLALYLIISTSLITLAGTMDSFLWDFGLRNSFFSMLLSCLICYFPPLPLIIKFYRKSTTQ